MREQDTATECSDPVVPDWAALSLPDAWPDKLNLRNPVDLWRLLALIFNKTRQKVEIPCGMLGEKTIPKYILQEFHNLPNGNYSKQITRGYITGFEHVMIGSIGRVRRAIAEQMKDLHSVLDVGCAGGRMAAALKSVGVKDVWGIDPSPYLLQHAAQDYAGIHFVQGVAEKTGFPAQRFDGLTVCFLLHELPPRYLDCALREFQRILKPGGLLAISEPSSLQRQGSWISFIRHQGFTGWYFRMLANFVYEPFLDAWHQQDINKKMAEFGFELIQDKDALPIRQLLARKISD